MHFVCGLYLHKQSNVDLGEIISSVVFKKKNFLFFLLHVSLHAAIVKNSRCASEAFTY